MVILGKGMVIYTSDIYKILRIFREREVPVCGLICRPRD